MSVVEKISEAIPDNTTNGIAMMAIGQVMGLLLCEADQHSREAMIGMAVKIANQVADAHGVKHGGTTH